MQITLRTPATFADALSPFLHAIDVIDAAALIRAMRARAAAREPLPIGAYARCVIAEALSCRRLRDEENVYAAHREWRQRAICGSALPMLRYARARADADV